MSWVWVVARAVWGLGPWSQDYSDSESVFSGISPCENSLMLSGVRMSA
jgi:hypothetical protein